MVVVVVLVVVVLAIVVLVLVVLVVAMLVEVGLTKGSSVAGADWSAGALQLAAASAETSTMARRILNMMSPF
jgi:hypothetical protein